MESKRRYASTALIRQELEVIELPAPSVKARKDLGPAALGLVTMGELDVGMWEGVSGDFELLKTDDWNVCRRGWPGVVLNHLAPNSVHVDEMHARCIESVHIYVSNSSSSNILC